MASQIQDQIFTLQHQSRIAVFRKGRCQRCSVSLLRRSAKGGAQGGDLLNCESGKLVRYRLSDLQGFIEGCAVDRNTGRQQ